MPESWRHARFIWGRMVRRDADLPPSAKLVAWALCEQFADADTGRCHPSIATLAEATGYGERQIKSAVKALETAGYLSVIRGVGRANRSTYELVMPEGKGADVFTFKPREKVQSSTGKGAVECTSLREPSREPKAHPPASRDPEDMEHAWPHVIERWSAWLRTQGLPAEKLGGLIIGDRIDVPDPLPPEPGSWLERSRREWFADRFATITTEPRRSA